MDYKGAFEILINKHSLDITNNAFLFYSLMEDFKIVLNERTLIKAFYYINKKQDIAKVITKLSFLDAEKHIKELIDSLPKEYSLDEYNRSIEPLLEFIFADEYKKIKKENNQQIIKPIIKKRVNKPAPRPKHPIMNAINRVNLEVNCKAMDVFFGFINDILIYDQDGVVVNDKAHFTQKGNELSVSLHDVSQKYTIMLPRKKYQNLNVCFVGSELVLGNDNNCCKPLNITIDSTYADIYVNVATPFLKVHSRTGKVVIKGKIRNVEITSDTGDVYADITSGHPREYAISTNTGNISLAFPFKIRPAVNNIFRKTRDVSGGYIVGKRYVNLTLKTNTGSIKVR